MWWIERKHLFSSGPLTNCHQSNSSHNLGPLFVAWPGEEQETWEENRLRHTRYFITYLCTLITPNANIYVVILANILSTLEIPTSNCELTRHWGAGEHLCRMLRRNGGMVNTWAASWLSSVRLQTSLSLSIAVINSTPQWWRSVSTYVWSLVNQWKLLDCQLLLPIFLILLSPILTNEEWSDTDICALYL